MEEIKQIQIAFNQIEKARVNRKNGLQLIAKIEKQLNDKKVVEVTNIYLYVPYDHKTDAKKDGCMWDPNRSKWFVKSKNPNCQLLKEKWNSSCFRDDFYGTHRRYKSIKDIPQKEEYNEAKHGSYQNYSVNVMGHE
jgi:hypothetical protein